MYHHLTLNYKSGQGEERHGFYQNLQLINEHKTELHFLPCVITCVKYDACLYLGLLVCSAEDEKVIRIMSPIQKRAMLTAIVPLLYLWQVKVLCLVVVQQGCWGSFSNRLDRVCVR